MTTASMHTMNSTPGTTTGHTSAILASRVIGTKVRDGSGRDVGEVEDIVLDKTYYAGMGNYNSVYYGAPRNVLAQLRYKF